MKIGIVAQDQDGETVGVRKDYLQFIEEIGGKPVVIYPTDKVSFIETYKLDRIILPGGSDIDSSRYGQRFSILAYRPNLFLEYFDNEILPLLVEWNMPIFGICRGLQTLNVFFGGTLQQHLWGHSTSNYDSHLVHEVSIKTNTEKPWIQKVNSSHHQGILKLAPGFIATAKSPDKVIEAIRHTSKKIAAVQWHPERIYDDYAIALVHEIFS